MYKEVVNYYIQSLVYNTEFQMCIDDTMEARYYNYRMPLIIFVNQSTIIAYYVQSLIFCMGFYNEFMILGNK
jgi:hypothetical protein